MVAEIVTLCSEERVNSTESVLHAKEGKEGDLVKVALSEVAPATVTTKEDVADWAYPERWE